MSGPGYCHPANRSLAPPPFQELLQLKAQVPGRIVVFAYPWRGYSNGVKYRMASHMVVAKLGGVASLIRSAGGCPPPRRPAALTHRPNCPASPNRLDPTAQPIVPTVPAAPGTAKG